MFEHFQPWMDYEQFIKQQAKKGTYRLKKGIPTWNNKQEANAKKEKPNTSAVQSNQIKYLRIGRK